MPIYSEIKTVHIQQCAPEDKGVCLRWINNLGAWETWYFPGEKTEEVAVNDPIFFKNSTQRGRQVLAKPGVRTLILRGGGLSKQEKIGISSIATSPQVYIQSLDGTLTPVTVAMDSFSVYDEGNGLHEVEVVIETKTLNSQTN